MSAFLLAPLVASCGGGGGTDPDLPPASRLALATEPSGLAETLEPLAVQPIVQLTDDAGRPAEAATTVSVEVADGNGVVTAGGTAVTNGAGRASFSGLTLGAKSGAVGPVTLRFTAPGLVPVTAASAVDLRCAVSTLTLGQSANGALAPGSCTIQNGRLFSTFEMTTSQPLTAVRLSARGNFRSILAFRGPNQPPLFFGVSGSSASDSPVLRLLLPPGRSEVTVAGFDPGATGTFTVESATEASTSITCDEAIQWAVGPITTTQRLGGAGDCLENGSYRDYLIIGIPLGATLTATMTTSAFQPALELQRESDNVPVLAATAANSTTLTYRDMTGVGLYILRMASNAAGGTGDYTLSISVNHPSSATSAAPRLAGISASSVRDATP